jgi:hypothetical protein
LAREVTVRRLRAELALRGNDPTRGPDAGCGLSAGRKAESSKCARTSSNCLRQPDPEAQRRKRPCRGRESLRDRRYGRGHRGQRPRPACRR